jgi:hypothetical protein
MKIPWLKILVASAQKTLGIGILVLLGISARIVWTFIYNTDNQFGHIIVSMIVGCLWIIYAIISVIVGMALLSKDVDVSKD